MADLRTHRELTERGEGAIVSALMRLGSHYVILPHLLLPGMLGPRNPDDLDVVVIGPMGAALLEYRHWHGRLVLAPSGQPWVLHYAAGGTEERPNPGDTLKDKAEALLEHFQANGVAPHAFVSAVVVPDRTRTEGEAGVTVIPASGVARWIEDALHGDETPWIGRAADLLRPPAAPRMINQYRLTTLLRRQGDRTTYLAFDTLKSRVVVMHELPYDPFQRPDEFEKLRTDLLREAKLTLELQHPAIARVEQLIPQDDCYYVVGEWVEGAQSLREVLGTGTLGLEAALDMAIACADGLSYAHEKGIVHRNVRPENILMAGRTVKLSDFRMAKKADMGTRSSFDLRQMVQENPYAAPEFRLGAEGHHRVDVRADIYALGSVLYEALTGQPPTHLDEKYWTPPSSVNAKVPPALDDTIQAALRFDPSQRLSTMAALRERLLAIREGRPVVSRLTRFEDRKLIKRTRNSLLYRAMDPERGREVAIKKLLLDPLSGAEERKAAIARLRREAKIAGALVHPRIVTVLDDFVEDDDPYVVMEWLDGHDLREHLDGKRQALTVEESLEVVTQVGEALSYAHEQGVVHQDIKPENLMLFGLKPTILDFGLASAAYLDPTGEDPSRPGGTPRYMPPEALRGGVADARGDIFSLAVVLYELLTGRYPYGADLIMSRFATLDGRDAVAPPSHLNLGVPAGLDAPLLKALSIDPTERQATMAEFLSELSAGASDDAGVLGARGVPWKGLIAAGVGVLVVGVSGVALYLGGPGLFGPSKLLTLRESSAPGASVMEASPSVAPLALVASPVPSPTSPASTMEAGPTPQLTPAPNEAPSKVVWASGDVSSGHVSVRVERVETTPSGDAVITFHVSNRTREAVTLLKADMAANGLSISDDTNEIYTQDVDWDSISATLADIPAGRTVEGTLKIKRSINPEAGQINVLVKDDTREFNLRAHRMEIQ